MSAMGDKKHDKRGPKQRYNPGSSGRVTWADVNAETLKAVIVAVSETGCAVRFGYSRDKGAYAVGIVGDGDPYTIWGASVDELDIKLEGLEQAFLRP